MRKVWDQKIEFMEQKRWKQPDLVSVSIQAVENNFGVYFCIKPISCLQYYSLFKVMTNIFFKLRSLKQHLT